MLSRNWLLALLARADDSSQYIKEETLTTGPNGKEARATRLITERASRRIGKMAFEVALARSSNVRLNVVHRDLALN
jgi:homoisocitrate dehydrogenase